MAFCDRGEFVLIVHIPLGVGSNDKACYTMKHLPGPSIKALMALRT